MPAGLLTSRSQRRGRTFLVGVVRERPVEFSSREAPPTFANLRAFHCEPIELYNRPHKAPPRRPLARMPLMSGITRWLQREAEMAGWYRLYLTAILWAPILLMLL